MRVLIVRLSAFGDVVKSTPHQYLYGECVRVLDDASVDFLFLPGERQRSTPDWKPLSLRGRLPMRSFDLILVSNSYAVELINLPSLLLRSGIPFHRFEREADPSCPIIVMGGSNSLASQAVRYSDDDAMVDALAFGEGEGNTTPLVEALSKAEKEDRRKVLGELQGRIPGLKVFGVEGPVGKAILSDTSHDWLASSPQFLFDSAEATTARLQISYGCPYFCTFCFEGWERKPYREIPLDKLLEAARHLKRETGAETLEITSFNYNTHHDVVGLMMELNKLFWRVNFMSQRADILAAHPELLPFEVASDKRQFTIGVEGISERMRCFFHKNLDKARFMTVLRQMFGQTIREVKLFFILSGFETDDDIADFDRLLSSVGKLRSEQGRGVRILCSFGLLVRMPFTPLRYAPLMLEKGAWDAVVSKVRAVTERQGYEFRLTYPYDEFFLSQCLVIDRRHTAPALEEMARQGLVYESSLPSPAWPIYKKLFPPTEELLGEKPEDWPFAYGEVDCHVPSSFLYRRWLDAKAGKEHPTCMGGSCQGCGACNPDQREALTGHTIGMPGIMDARKMEELMKEKARSKPFWVKVAIPKEYALGHVETKEAYVNRLLMAAIDDGEGRIMKVQDAFFDSELFPGMMRWWGDDWFAVWAFTNDKRGKLMADLGKKGYQTSEEQPKQAIISLTIEHPDQKKLLKGAEALLASMQIPFTRVKKDDAVFFDIAPRFLKKHVLDSCKVQGNVLRLKGSNKMKFGALSHSGLVAHVVLG